MKGSRENAIPLEPVSITYQQPDPTVARTNDKERQIAWRALHKNTDRLIPSPLSKTKMLVRVEDAFLAMFPHDAPANTALSPQEKLRRISQDALDFVNQISGCNNKSANQLAAEKGILEYLDKNILIRKMSDYTRHKCIKGVFEQMKNITLPPDCFFLFKPTIIVEHEVLRQYKALCGKSNRNPGDEKCQFYEDMGEQGQIRLLKTAYENYERFRYHCMIVRVKGEGPAPGSPATTTEAEGRADIEGMVFTVHYINGAPFQVLETSSKDNQCGLQALRLSLLAQGHATQRWGNEVLNCTLAEFQDILKMTLFIEPFRELFPNKDVPTNWFSEDELALILQIWGEIWGRKLQLGVFEEWNGHRISLRNEGAYTVWIYHDGVNHWCGIKFPEGPPSDILKEEDMVSARGNTEPPGKEEQADDDGEKGHDIDCPLPQCPMRHKAQLLEHQLEREMANRRQVEEQLRSLRYADGTSSANNDAQENATKIEET